jgi:hypothetical protein
LTVGPFDVTPAQIVGLEARFSAFLNKLLALELRATGTPAHQLTTTDNEAAADGGVDAMVRDAFQTDWIPLGDSGWQFKSENVGPTACANELADAERAQDVLRSGGSYIVTMGTDLPDNRLEDRRRAMVEKALELELIESDDRSRIRVYGASILAAWASRYPGLAVSELLGGPGRIAVEHGSWSALSPHHVEWVADPAREAAIRTIREAVQGVGAVGLRVCGPEGIGKSRLALEALRDEALASMVAYFADESTASAQLIQHLVDEQRTAILVVDDCVPERHSRLLGRLPRDSTIKLVTIGAPGSTFTSTPVLEVGRLDEERLLALLRSQYPQVPEEQRRLVAAHCFGNPRWAMLLADKVVVMGPESMSDLIARGDIEAFVSAVLPEGSALFPAAVLALCERVGWDRELRSELELLADFAGMEPSELEAVGDELERGGLLVRQGRYRAVSPQPVAVFLAAEAWRMYADRIVSDLLPRLGSMAPAFFRRVAALGRIEPARRVLPSLLGPNGPYGSLDSIEARSPDTSLTELAIVLPLEVSRHLSTLIRETDLEVLRAQRQSRRDLVWTLEKLAWNRLTFTEAADSLLRLALAENETYANNAGGTWVDLFGTMLPGTAASPEERISYLSEVAERQDPAQRSFAVKACERILSRLQHETIVVSGEIQGGVLVEPRGRPETWGDVKAYRESGIEVLGKLRHDPEKTIAAAATEVAISAIHPLLDDPWGGEALRDLVAGFEGDDLTRVRREVEHLIQLRERFDRTEEDSTLLEKLRELRDLLPTPTPLEDLRVTLEFREWDFEDRQLSSRVEERLAAVQPDERVTLLEELQSKDVPAAYELGKALAAVEGKQDWINSALVTNFEASPNMLFGYLAGLVAGGNEAAFDEFIESDLADALDETRTLDLTVRGPDTDAAKARVQTLTEKLPVAQVTRALFAWRRNLVETEMLTLASEWLPRLETQDDYDAIVDWLAFYIFDHKEATPEFKRVAFPVVQAREKFPKVGRQNWDWAQITGPVVEEHATEIAALLLRLLDSEQLRILQHEYESEILMRCAATEPAFVWQEVGERLERGSWRVQLEIRGWLIDAIPVDVIDDWVGDSVERARLVASVATSRADSPTHVARYLLDRFGDDEKIRGELAGALMSGTWTGPESLRLTEMIDQLRGWNADASEPTGVREWAEWMVEGLTSRREHALEREAEGDW